MQRNFALLAHTNGGATPPNITRMRLPNRVISGNSTEEITENIRSIFRGKMAGPSPQEFRVRFKKWVAVAEWKWITPNEETECGICRIPFEGCCPDCRFPGDDCALGGRG